MRGKDAIRVILAALVALGVAAWFAVPTPGTPIGPVHAPVLLLAIMIGAAEVAAIHLDLGRDRHKMSMSELPLTLGFFLVLPRELLIAQLIGLLIQLWLVRRESPLRLMINLSQAWVSTAMGLIIFQLLLPAAGATALSPRAWAAAALGALGTSLISGAIISHVIAVQDGRIGLTNLRASVTGASLGALGNASIGLLVVVLLTVNPAALLLLLLPAGALFGAYRVYERQRTANRSLSFLYGVSQALAGDAEVDTSLAELTGTVRDRMRVRLAVVVVAPNTSDSLQLGLVANATDGAEPRVEHRALTPLELEGVAGLDGSETMRVSTTKTRKAPSRVGSFDPRPLLRELGVPGDALLVPLRGPERALGYVVAAERLGDHTTLTPSDQALLEAVANQLSTSLTAARLESSLSELHNQQETLRHRAEHDALTGLCNRTRFTAEVDDQLTVDPTRTAVLFLDLDGFKSINDSMGHHVGDELLQAVARRIEGATKVTDLAARLGGDEFAVLLRDVSKDRATAVAHRLATVLGNPFDLTETTVTVSSSVGVAHHDDDPSTSSATLLRNADTAMYVAKRDATSGTRSFEQSMHEQARSRVKLRGELQRGMSEIEFGIHLQPLVRLSDEKIVGAEALLRWNHPTQGVLAPGSFLDLAEESGLMPELGHRVLRESCRVAAGWHDDTFVSVNLSRSQLLSHDAIIAEVAGALAESGLAPARLLLEITEAAVMSDIERSAPVLDELTKLGVRIALEQFGTSHSSLQHLARLDVHVLKIAKPFVDAVATDGATGPTALIARGIVDLADALGLQTIAVGIEHEAQVGVLRSWGADVGQGYLLGRPMAASRFVAGGAPGAIEDAPLHV
ncbi:MAG: diguanylate cyclase (GGDEF)-like protein [Nonlabens sp.]|jgi:diguanylate cyclase (GGDEF)-like protein